MQTASPNLLSPPAAAQGNRYLYGVIDADGERRFGSIGIENAEVYTVPVAGLAAVVSNLRERRIRPQRLHLAAHHTVLNTLAREFTVLPMTFGMITRSEEDVRRVLDANREELSGQLRRIAGKVEMGLKVHWDVPNIFEFFLSIHEELRESRDECFRRGQRPSQEQLLEMGMAFERTLEADRLRHASAISRVLKPCCCEIKSQPTKDEKEVANLACLVERDQVAAFEKAVIDAASSFDQHYSFDYSGPWLPSSFVDLRMNL